MTKDQIIAMAREAQFLSFTSGQFAEGRAIQVFANLVAAQAAAEEREECARACEAVAMSAAEWWDVRCDPHDQGREFGADECAAAIRERK